MSTSMNYADINKAMVLPERQRSLFNKISAAQMAAKQSDETIYVIHSPFYVDENVDSLHVYAAQAASILLYKKRAGIEWDIDAAVEPSGSVFFNRPEDLAVILEYTKNYRKGVLIQ
jgi:hypothetical protein